VSSRGRVIVGVASQAERSDGRSKLSGLPPGAYYIIALDYLDTTGDWNEPESLDRLRSKAAVFSVNEGETKTMDLKIATVS